MGRFRRGEILGLLLFLSLAGGLCHLSRPPAWLEEELRGRGGSGGGFSIRYLEGFVWRRTLLGGRKARISGRRARVRAPRLGPLSLGGSIEGLDLEAVEVGFERPPRLLRAGRGRLTSEGLELEGGVRWDREAGEGLLFSSELFLSWEKDWLDTRGLFVLEPEGEVGGFGGRALPGFQGSLEALLEKTGR